MYYHDYYFTNLPELSRAEIEAAFQGMLWEKPVTCGVIRDEAHLAHLKAMVGRTNGYAAEVVAGTEARSRVRLKVVVWRGCYAVVRRRAENKKRRWVGPAVVTRGRG